MKIVVLLLTFMVGSALSWSGYRLNFEHHDLEFDENIINMDMNMKHKDERTIINIRSELLENIDTEIYFNFAVYERGTAGNYMHFLNGTLNSCNFLARVKFHPILKLIFKEIWRSTNFPTACPVKKGLYYMKDFTINEDILPPFLPLGSFMSYISVSRMIEDEQQNILSFRLLTNIDYARDKAAMKIY